MQSIALPKKIQIIPGSEPHQSLVVIEPLFPGYGTTVGNALRRVLLSSLPGAAVIGVKIEGADHEFMAVPKIKEDVLEILLNLKKLSVKIHTDEVVKLELDAHGEKEVKASDIKKNSDVEIINGDMTIAHITDMAGKLKMEIFVTKGMGYETIENRENRKKEIGYIEIDSIFTPVRAVGLSVENTRVGKMTNWDKLTLNITTNGVLTPEEAFEESTKILIQQFNALLKSTASEEATEETETEIE
jgi:DNA-directed RNA polymerase subunit alpha